MQPIIEANRVRQLFLMALILLIGIVLFRELSFYIPALLGALTLYILLRSTFFRLTELRKWKKGPTALLLMMVSLLMILFPVALLLQMLSGKLTYALEHSGELVISLKQVVAEIETRYHIVILSEANINKVGEWMASLLPRMLGATFNSLSTIFFLYFILYFLFTQGRAFEKALAQYMPFRADNVGLLEKEVHSMVVANAVGIPVVAFAQGVIGLVGYLLIGVKEPFFWFGITCIAGMLPVIGAALAYIPLIIIFLANGQMGQGVAMFVFGFGVIGTVDNFLRFTLLRKIGDVHPLVTVFGVIAGLSLFGFIGLIFGPLLISLLLLLIRIYRSEFVVKHRAIG
ncbi:AI-2E family transporter [Bacteroidota bacterium]|nr:AI-2E family transporter [Bacteroidota bacterium]